MGCDIRLSVEKLIKRAKVVVARPKVVGVLGINIYETVQVARAELGK